MTRQPRTRPTLEDVAAAAGVGRGTASRVINGSSKVSEKARQAVEGAIAELGYVPNRAARTLVTQRTDAVALVIAESEERVFGEPFFAGAVRGVSTALSDARLQLVLLLAHAAQRNGRLDDYLTRQHVDGVLLVSLTTTTPSRTGSGRGACPWCWAVARPITKGPYVEADNVLGARLAVDHLVHRGRRRIGAIPGPPTWWWAGPATRATSPASRPPGWSPTTRSSCAATSARTVASRRCESSCRGGRTSTPSSAPTT